MKALDDLVYGLIAERRTSGQPKNDLLDMLLKAQDQDTGEGMSDRQLRDEILTMFAAGHETTAITLTWTLYLLSQHPEILRKVQEEVDAALGGRTPTLADLPNMPYTLQVFEESMRLYPSAPIVPRLTSKETTLGGLHRPGQFPGPGQPVQRPPPPRLLARARGLQPGPVHPRGEEGPAPVRLHPLRRRAACVHRQAFRPAGGPPAAGDARRRYEFRHVPSHRVVNHATITLRPRYGMQMTIHPRRRPWPQDGRAGA